MRSRLFLCLMLCLYLAIPVLAGDPPQAPSPNPFVPRKPTVIRLPSGMRVVVVEEADSPVIAVEVFFLVGLADEKRYPGVNALIARTWGSDSENRIGASLRTDIARIGSMGTDFAEDWVELWGLCASDKDELSKLLQTLLTNLVANPLFTAENVTRAKEEQRQALLMDRDDLLSDVLEQLRGRIWSSSPYGLSLMGNDASISALTPEVVKAYYKSYFRPSRCIITVVGPTDAEETRKLIEDSLGAGGWSQKPAPLLPTIAQEEVPAGLKDLVLPRTAPGGIVALGYLAPGTAVRNSREDYAALLLLDAVLGGGKSSRLFSILRDARTGQMPVGYDVRTQVSGGRGQSLWTAYITGSLRPIASRDALKAELDAIANGERPITAEDLDRARTFLKARHQRERQRIKSRSFGAAWSEVMGLGADFDTDFPARLDAITLDALNTLARRLLSAPAAVAYSPTAVP